MMENIPNKPIVGGWKVRATTIYCDSVDADVPIMVYKDWSTKCMGYQKYCESMTKDLAKILKKRKKKLNRELGCDGPECSRVIAYRDKVFAEEENKRR